MRTIPVALICVLMALALCAEDGKVETVDDIAKRVKEATQKKQRELEPQLSDPDQKVRVEAALQLLDLTGNAERSMPVFEAALASKRPFILLRRLAARDLGPSARGLVTPLLKLITNNKEGVYDEYDCALAVQALGNIGPAARDALPLLENLRGWPVAYAGDDPVILRLASKSEITAAALEAIGKIRQDLPDMSAIAVRAFNIVQKTDEASFRAISTKAFLNEAKLAQLCDVSVTDVRFASSTGTFDEVNTVLDVAYGRDPMGVPSYIHELHMSFRRENGELKLNSYMFFGW